MSIKKFLESIVSFHFVDKEFCCPLRLQETSTQKVCHYFYTLEMSRQIILHITPTQSKLL